jgi:hypothetical protein
MRTAFAFLVVLLLGACAASSPTNSPAAGNMFLVRQTAKTPDQAIDALKEYAQAQKWVFLGANKVKGGELALVKVCIPAVGAAVWNADLSLSAMLPCGNLAVYQKAGRTEISMLDPRYMTLLSSHPEVARASSMAGPLLTQMLDAAAK